MVLEFTPEHGHLAWGGRRPVPEGVLITTT
jgi:hypothetical protein